MVIHGQTFAPSDVRRLVVEYTGPNGPGLLDLTGPAAAAAMREIARHSRPASGKPNGPKPVVGAVVLSTLKAATADPNGITVDEIVRLARAKGWPVSKSRVVAVVRQFADSGQIERGPDLPQARGAPLHRYRVANTATEGAAP